MRSWLNKGEGGPAAEACVLIASEADLEAAVGSRDKLMVLFYATWCPFSRSFLKIYTRHAAAGDPCYARFVIDDADPIVAKYGIEIFPTVLFFDKGELVRRLDGVYHRGLSRGDLEDFARQCAVR
jgi:thioredoxin-like negative regulator of GroEL